MTPYEALGQTTLYAVIDRFYEYVAADERINYLFPGDFAETARKQKQFLTQFLGGPDLYSQEHGHPMLRMRHMPFVIGPAEKDAWLESIYKALHAFEMDDDLRAYIYQRLELTAAHMVNTECR